MKRVTMMLMVLCLVATLIVCGKVFAEQDTSNAPKSVKSTDAIKTTEPTEPTEATIPYSAPYDSPNDDAGADAVEVDEDA